MDFDTLDAAILRVLQRAGRISNAELAERVHLSASACHRRVQRLEAEGVIRYKDLSAERLERLATLLTLALNHPGSSQQVRDQAAQLLRQLAAADLSPAIVAAARERGQSITIDAMVEEILHDLQTAETTPIG
jgi:DNA-binding Lrp family transcriptional regulator